MNYQLFQRPALVFSLASLTVLTCLEVPIFISCFCALLWGWKWLAEMKTVSPLSRRLTTVLSFILLGYIFFEYRTLIAQEASSGLLVGLTALKVMDYSNRRDHLLVILLGFLLLTLKPLYGLDLYWLPIQMVCMISLWWALSQDPRKLPKSALISVFVSALPIALFLFLVFPRIVFPWAMTQSRHGGVSRMGFSTDLNPGEVAELAASGDLVFRVRFPSAVDIEQEDLYWKGAVLTSSKGMTWQASKPKPVPQRGEFSSSSPVIPYELIQEPGNLAIFVLDRTYNLKSTDSKAVEIEHSVWRTSSASSTAQRYMGKASIGYEDKTKPTEADLKVQSLPPESSRWVESVKEKTSDPFARKRALRELFSHPQFVYTLTPGKYEKNSMDEFLFHRRRGFCEHFAGSYATLARALGIPARVVSGYQGAEFNPLGNFWRVTQKQAHAWVEIWNGESWQRQDPTAWVANVEYTRVQQKSFYQWVNEASDMYENLNYRWTTFLLDFDRNAQKIALREWLPRLALGGIAALIVFFLMRLVHSWFFSPGNRALQIRHHQLSQLLLQIKEVEEEKRNQDLSHWPPLQIVQSAKGRSPQSEEFYQRVSRLYDRAFYKEDLGENELRDELQNLQRQWVDIQVLQK